MPGQKARMKKLPCNATCIHVFARTEGRDKLAVRYIVNTYDRNGCGCEEGGGDQLGWGGGWYLLDSLIFSPW